MIVRCIALAMLCAVASGQVVHISGPVTQEPDWSLQGTVVAASADPATTFLGSPSLLRLDADTLLLSSDIFGISFNTCIVHRSADGGTTWTNLASITDQFWSTLFLVGGDVYMLGTAGGRSNVRIRKSTDSGATWSSGVDLFSGDYRTAPTPVLHHAGRYWKGYNIGDTGSGYKNDLCVVSAADDADLMSPASWTRSTVISWDDVGDSAYDGWNEPNCVPGLSNDIAVISVVLEYETGGVGALLSCTTNGNTLSFTGHIALPGGEKKFHVLYMGGVYHAWGTALQPKNQHYNAQRIRNGLSVATSTNLTDWSTSWLIWNPWIDDVGYQYPSVIMEDGTTVRCAIRTAYEYNGEAPNSVHNNNLITFHELGYEY